MKPTNISLLDPKTIIPGIFKPVTSTDAFEGMTQNLHEDGLYSVNIFGRVGTSERDSTEAFINTGLSIFNPTYFKALIQLKSLYLGILKGAEYAIWDPVEKDFIKSNILEGETGFSFFMRHFGEIVPKQTNSYKRKQRITLFDTQKDKAMTNKVIVIPAGIRDIQFQPNGTVTEAEINDLYRKLIFKTRAVNGVTKQDEDNALYDAVRWGMQEAFNNIDQYLFESMEGKGGFLQNKLGTRGVVGGTRNVITARIVSREKLFEYDGVTPNSTDIGLYQALMAFQYVCLHALSSNFLERVFTNGSTTAKLVNPKTLEFEYVELSTDIIDKWTTVEGLLKLFNGFANVHLRHKQIRVAGHYLGLVYDDGKEVRLMSDINELPEGRDKKHVSPLTYIELFYLCCQKTILDQMLQQTRYPITGIGSIYPSEINLLTIHGAKQRSILNDYWEVEEKCNSYPHKTEHPDYFDAMSVDPSKEAGLGSDHDGDQLNANGIMGEDSKNEARALIKRREYYIGGSGNFLYDPITEPLLFLFKAATSGLSA